MRFLDVFVERLDLQQLGFNRVETAVERRATSHLGDLLKLYLSKLDLVANLIIEKFFVLEPTNCF